LEIICSLCSAKWDQSFSNLQIYGMF